MIYQTLAFIQQKAGISLQLCDYFKGVRTHLGEKYFNVVLSDQTSISEDFEILQKLANEYDFLRVEANGLQRVSIFVNNFPKWTFIKMSIRCLLKKPITNR